MAKKKSLAGPAHVDLTTENFGDLLVQGLTELRDGLRGVPGKLTLKTRTISTPTAFRAKDVRHL